MPIYTDAESPTKIRLLDDIQKYTLNLQKSLDALYRLKLNGKSSLSEPSVSLLRNQVGSENKPYSASNIGIYGYHDDDLDSQASIEDMHYDDLEGDNDMGAFFPCPFCHLPIEIHSLCSHLQEEHCFNLKNSGCPLCAANLDKDVIGHFIVQHASLVKGRRELQKSGLWPGIPATLGKDLNSFLGSSGNTCDSLPNQLLLPSSIFKDFHGDDDLANEGSVSSQLKSLKPTFVDKDVELHVEERRHRAVFVQELISSTIL